MAYINLPPKCQEILRLTFTKTQYLKPVITAAAANAAAAHRHANTDWARLADEMRQLILACLGAPAPAFEAHLFFAGSLVITGVRCQPPEWQHGSGLPPPDTTEVAGVGANRV